MGGGSYDYEAYTAPAAQATRKAAVQSGTAFSRSLKDPVNAAKMTGPFGQVRESRDIATSPQATPIIIGLDVTGSMGAIPKYMFQEGLGTLFKEIYTRRPVTDPQVCLCAFDDVAGGNPESFQVGQFEAADGPLIESLQNFMLVSGGYGNGHESDDLVYYFAANHTVTDSMEKRGEKGILITIGDDGPPTRLGTQAKDVQAVFGYTPEADIAFEDLILKVKQSWIPIHITIQHGSYEPTDILDRWNTLLGEHSILCTDYTKLSEVIVAVLQANAGVAKDVITSSFSGNTSLVVQTALRGLTTTSAAKSSALVSF